MKKAEKIIKKARKSKYDKEFLKLFDGDILEHGNYDADLTLCKKLCYWCGDNITDIDNCFRQSKLMRPQWDQPYDGNSTYGQKTISTALQAWDGKVYQENRGRPKKGKSKKQNAICQINPFETDETKKRYSWDDIGISNFFADAHLHTCRYCPEAKSWFAYDGKVWRHDVGNIIAIQYAKDFVSYMFDCQKFIDDEKVKESWLKYVTSRLKKKNRDTMLADASSVHPICINDFDKDPYLFNVQNGTLDLRTIKLHPHNSGDFLSKMANVTFDKNAQCDDWKEFIEQIMQKDGEKAKFLQESFGYSLCGDTSEECFFIFYGNTTRNGKGTTLETILYLMGDYGRTAQPETIAQKFQSNGGAPSEDIARLKGARLVNISEPSKGLRLNSELVKSMTGGDTLTARFLHQNSFEFKPEYKLFINTNHLPRVNDDSIFASGRVKLIPFDRHFPESEQNKGLKQLFRKPENRSGILNWLLEGLRMYRANKAANGGRGLTQPPSVEAATERYRENSDVIGQFINECLVKKQDSKVSLQSVYSAYKKWCQTWDILNPINDSRALAKELRQKGKQVKNGEGNKVMLFDYLVCDNQHEPPPTQTTQAEQTEPPKPQC